MSSRRGLEHGRRLLPSARRSADESSTAASAPTGTSLQNANAASHPRRGGPGAAMASVTSAAQYDRSRKQQRAPIVRPVLTAGTPFASGTVGDGGAARQLQRADIGGDRPAVVRIDAIPVGVHHAVAAGDHIVEVRRGRREEAVDVVGRRLGKSVGDDDAVAVACEPVARRTDRCRSAPARAPEGLGGGGGVVSALWRGDVSLRDDAGGKRLAGAPLAKDAQERRSRICAARSCSGRSRPALLRVAMMARHLKCRPPRRRRRPIVAATRSPRGPGARRRAAPAPAEIRPGLPVQNARARKAGDGGAAVRSRPGTR